MASSFEWLNGPSRADLVTLTFVRSPTAQVRKNKFSRLVQWSLFVKKHEMLLCRHSLTKLKETKSERLTNKIDMS